MTKLCPLPRVAKTVISCVILSSEAHSTRAGSTSTLPYPGMKDGRIYFFASGELVAFKARVL